MNRKATANILVRIEITYVNRSALSEFALLL